PPTNPNNPNNMTSEAVQTMIDQALLRNSGGRDGSHSSHVENPRNMHTARPCYYANFMKCHPLNFKGTEGPVGLTCWIKKMKSVFNISRNYGGGDGSHSSHVEKPRNMHTARPCYYVDFMKCHPLNFKETEGAVGLTRWIKKIESVFNISGCAVENQAKFATCTLLDATLTWWNSQIRTLGPDAYTITWSVLKKKTTDKYCPLGEVKKLGIELWNLKNHKALARFEAYCRALEARVAGLETHACRLEWQHQAIDDFAF
nr:reverse transcriptase domain-containing protein [Tanacetum cinerariifolium]